MTTTVNHKLFGQGQLIELNNKVAIVNFNGEEKKLDIRFANLTDSEGNAIVYIKPKKQVAKKMPKVDYSKYSDAELIAMHNNLMNEIAEAKQEARNRLKVGAL